MLLKERPRIIVCPIVATATPLVEQTDTTKFNFYGITFSFTIGDTSEVHNIPSGFVRIIAHDIRLGTSIQVIDFPFTAQSAPFDFISSYIPTSIPSTPSAFSTKLPNGIYNIECQLIVDSKIIGVSWVYNYIVGTYAKVKMIIRNKTLPLFRHSDVWDTIDEANPFIRYRGNFYKLRGAADEEDLCVKTPAYSKGYSHANSGYQLPQRIMDEISNGDEIELEMFGIPKCLCFPESANSSAITDGTIAHQRRTMGLPQIPQGTYWMSSAFGTSSPSIDNILDAWQRGSIITEIVQAHLQWPRFISTFALMHLPITSTTTTDNKIILGDIKLGKRDAECTLACFANYVDESVLEPYINLILKLSGFNFNMVFRGTKLQNAIDINNLNWQSVSGLFEDTSITVPLAIDNNHVRYIDYLYARCYNMTSTHDFQIYITKNLTAYGYASSVFYGCNLLKTVERPLFSGCDVDAASTLNINQFFAQTAIDTICENFISVNGDEIPVPINVSDLFYKHTGQLVLSTNSILAVISAAGQMFYQSRVHSLEANAINCSTQHTAPSLDSMFAFSDIVTVDQSNIEKFTNVTTLMNMFRGCPNLTLDPGWYFKGLIKVVNATYAFYQAKVTGLGMGIFRDCPIQEASFVFSYATLVNGIMASPMYSNPMFQPTLTNISYGFYYTNNSLSSNYPPCPDNIINNCVNITDDKIVKMFGHSKWSSLPSNLFSGTSITNLSHTFEDAVVGDVGDICEGTLINTFDWTFANAIMTSLSPSLFSHLYGLDTPAILNYTFMGNNLNIWPVGLLDGVLVSSDHAFNLSSFEYLPMNSVQRATSLSYMFYGSKFKRIDSGWYAGVDDGTVDVEGLFGNNLQLTTLDGSSKLILDGDISRAFMYMPIGSFSGLLRNVIPTKLDYCLSNMPNVTDDINDIFDDLSQVISLQEFASGSPALTGDALEFLNRIQGLDMETGNILQNDIIVGNAKKCFYQCTLLINYDNLPTWAK